MVGVCRLQGQIMCIHAFFVQNFLIEYKKRKDDGLYEVPLFVESSLVRTG